MSDERKIQEAIERDEIWLAKVCARSEPVDTDAIKQRIRIEIGEQWLSRKLADTDDSQLEQRIREKVRASLAESSPKTETSRDDTEKSRSTVYRLYLTAASAVGIAATLFLTFGDVLGPATTTPKEVQDIDASYADAFEQYEGDDWDSSFGKLSDEFDSFASGSESGSGSAEWYSGASDGWFDTNGDTTDG